MDESSQNFIDSFFKVVFAFREKNFFWRECFFVSFFVFLGSVMGEYIPVTLIIYTHEYITPNRAGDDDDDVNDDDDDVFLSSLSLRVFSFPRTRESRER